MLCHLLIVQAVRQLYSYTVKIFGWTFELVNIYFLKIGSKLPKFLGTRENLAQYDPIFLGINANNSKVWSNKFNSVQLCNKFSYNFATLYWLSDVARPLSYKTKTTYFFKTKTGQAKTKTAFFKDHQIINPRPKTTGIALNFDWEGPKLENFCNVNLVTFLGYVMVMTPLEWRHNYTLKFDCVVISFKNHNLAKSRNFKLILRIKRRWGRKASSAWRFLKICY